MGEDGRSGGCGWGASRSAGADRARGCHGHSRYQEAKNAPAKRVIDGLRIPLAGRIYDIAVRELKVGLERRSISSISPSCSEPPGLYGDQRGDYPDNHIRFAVLSKAALEISRRLFAADVIHCHDWQASLAPAYLRDPRIADPHFLGSGRC